MVLLASQVLREVRKSNVFLEKLHQQHQQPHVCSMSGWIFNGQHVNKRKEKKTTGKHDNEECRSSIRHNMRNMISSARTNGTQTIWLMVITVKESKKSQITLSATHLRTHKYKCLLFTFFFLFSVHLYHNIFQKSTTYNRFRVSPLVM